LVAILEPDTFYPHGYPYYAKTEYLLSTVP